MTRPALWAAASTSIPTMSQSNDVPRPGHRLFPASQKVYVAGSREDLRVPMREIALSPTRLPNGTEVPNEPVRVYDTSGPWGDAGFHRARVLERMVAGQTD